MGVLALLASAMVLFAAQGFGADDRWTSGAYGGMAEAIVTHGPGNQIYATCNLGAAFGSTGISFTLAGDAPKGFSTIILTFDNEDPLPVDVKDGQVMSDCRICAANYDMVATALREHRSVHVLFPDGKATRFTLRGSREAIGDCKADFYR